MEGDWHPDCISQITINFQVFLSKYKADYAIPQNEEFSACVGNPLLHRALTIYN